VPGSAPLFYFDANYYNNIIIWRQKIGIIRMLQ
jgi:hypothetical protein